MGNYLNEEKSLKILEAFTKSKSIRNASKMSGTSRNTVKRLLKNYGLLKIPLSKAIELHAKTECEPMLEPLNAPPPAPYNSDAKTLIEKMDFYFLGDLIRDSSGVSDLVRRNMKSVGQITQKIGFELGINSIVDLLKLEAAVVEFISYKRFHKTAYATTSKTYLGPMETVYERQTKATKNNLKMAHQSLQNFLFILNDLEIKHGVRFPFQKANFTLNQNLNMKKE